MVSRKLIEELQNIMKEEYGADMTYADADSFGNKLVSYFGLLAKIDYESKKKAKELSKK
ncbi:MAG: hypothetical protein NUV69_04535 [Candidatus Curtissbacteria bacterium]|nr:hypothetical protein [Candidatus Curtissbacteria bacterium]